MPYCRVIGGDSPPAVPSGSVRASAAPGDYAVVTCGTMHLSAVSTAAPAWRAGTAGAAQPVPASFMITESCQSHPLRGFRDHGAGVIASGRRRAAGSLGP